MKFDHVIRFRGNITVTSADGDKRAAIGWAAPGGRATLLRGALVTAERYLVGTVVCVRDNDMKQAWWLASNRTDATAGFLKRLYGKHWGVGSGFRDTKDLRFGSGMGTIRASTPLLRVLSRPARPVMAAEWARIAWLTLLGAAGEVLGYDRLLKSNTTKGRTHSVFRQGGMLYDLIPTMPEPRLTR